MATHAEDQLGLVKITRALISVSDKAHLIDFAKSLAEHKVDTEMTRKHRKNYLGVTEPDILLAGGDPVHGWHSKGPKRRWTSG